MPIYRYTNDAIQPIASATFSDLGITERADLQRLLRDQIEIIAPDTLVIAEEFGDWEDSRRRIDLLAIDRDANLVVIELKRTEDGGHMELQALRYAAMVSTLTFGQAVEVFGDYLRNRNDDRPPEQTILEFLGWDEVQEEDFATDVRIVLASAEFSREVTTAVLWLNDRNLDIRCVRIKPYGNPENTLLDVQQIVPLPEAEDYQVRVRERHQRERASRRVSRDYTKFDVQVGDQQLTGLPKRRAIYAIVRGLCDSGVTPEQIGGLIAWRRNLFREIDGQTDGATFCATIRLQEPRFDTTRWGTDDDELIHMNGKTYVFTNQWGNRTESAMRMLLEHFEPANISFQRTT